MTNGKPMNARAELQARVSKVVWGLLLITAGVLLTLDDNGVITLDRSSRFSASQAVDGDMQTRWASRWRDGQWITVDLGAPSAISKVRLRWETAYATAYDIEVSDDGQLWNTVVKVADGDGELDEHTVDARGRYVRVTGHQRAAIQQGNERRRYGVSLWELEVYGPDERPLSRGTVATASSAEGASLWAMYWPVLLIAGGLPGLLVPKNSGDRVWGILFSGAGVILQLRNLDILRVGFWQAVPVLLILGGLALILEAARHQNGDDPIGGGASGAAEGLR